MARYDEELLETARLLLVRPGGARGRLARARVRRSISTAYYALFHFLLDSAARSMIGTRNGLSQRRRILMRLFTHTGIATALMKVRGAAVDVSVVDYLRPPGAAAGPFAAPLFARNLAAAFQDAQAKRHDADYDLNKSLVAEDAELLIDRVQAAIRGWDGATGDADKDFKSAFWILMLMKGQLRKEN